MSELGNQSSTWGRVVGDLQVPDLADLPDGSLDPAGRAGLEADLSAFAVAIWRKQLGRFPVHDTTSASRARVDAT